MAELSTLARPYAKAVFELAQSSNQLAEWSETLAALAAVTATSEVRALIGNPHVSEARLSELVAEAGKLNDAGTNLVRLLAGNGRLHTATLIAEQYEAMRAEAENRIDVDVVSASELSADQQDKLSTALAKRLGREVRLACSVEPEILGGAVIRAGDLVIDGSLRAELQRLSHGLAH